MDKKKHIVFLGGSVVESPSAVGLCGINIISELKKTFEITVISFGTGKDQIILGIRYVFIKPPCKLKITTIRDFANIYFCILLKLKFIFNNTSVNDYMVENILNKLKILHNKNPFFGIVSLTFPIETVVAMSLFKKTHTELITIPILFDNFIESKTLNYFAFIKKIKFNNNIKLFNSILNNANLILSMHSLKKMFQTYTDDPIIESTEFVEHPLIVKPLENKTTKNRERIRVVFAGGLSRNHVEPYYVLKLIDKININVVFEFYTFGNLFEKFKSVTKLKKNILVHEKVDRVTLSEVYQNADYLLSIGELKGEQMSSKIFDYISYTKPIIHVSYTENDINKKILNKYPNSLILNVTDSFESNMTKLEEFISNIDRTNLSFKEVFKLFNDATPNYIAKKIKERIEIDNS